MTVRILAAIAATGWTVYFVILGSLHVLPTGYSPARNAVSDYGVGRYRRWFQGAVLANGTAGLALVAALLAAEGSPALPALDLGLLALVAVSRLVMSVVPADVEGQRLTWTGAAHYALAIIGFAATYQVVTHLTPVLRALHPWATASGLLAGLAAVVLPALAAVVVTLVPGLRRRIFGLAERLFLVATNLWYLTVAASLVIWAT